MIEITVKTSNHAENKLAFDISIMLKILFEHMKEGKHSADERKILTKHLGNVLKTDLEDLKIDTGPMGKVFLTRVELITTPYSS
tara:strand:- start:9 stop:260 length:252 start_codon:yes stop_codon:yes gene_type:complete